MSSRIEPSLLPYRNSGQLASLIGAATGAAEYELATGYRDRASSSADGLALLLALVVIAAIASNVVYWIGRKRAASR